MTLFPWKRAIVVGASSGMGEAVARQLAQSGCRVALVARREDTLQRIAKELNEISAFPIAFVYAHDVHEVWTVPVLFEQIVTELGGLDLVVYASGVMPRTAHDEYNIEKDQETIAVNFTGAVSWLNEAARRFEKLGSGTIVGVSSVAGDRGRRGNVVYGATKAALNTYLESLRNRIERRGALVVTVKPGPVETPMTHGLKMPGMISADQAAQDILKAARDRVRVAYISTKWRPIMFIIRNIPSAIFKWLNI